MRFWGWRVRGVARTPWFPASACLALVIAACSRGPAATARSDFGGLVPEQFDSILSIERPNGTTVFVGQHNWESLGFGGRMAGVVVTTGGRAEFDGFVSPDEEDRWLRMHWLDAAPRCPHVAWHEVFLHWARRTSLTADGTLSITCRDEPPVRETVVSRLLYDPEFAPLSTPSN